MPDIPDIPSLDEQEPFVSPRVECQPVDTNYIERDPGKRPAIASYHINEQDDIRKRYVLYGPYQPKLEEYPSHFCGDEDRRFNGKWFEKYPWLEYSKNDKAYCFPCFIFENNLPRGDDESVESYNRSNIVKTVDSYGRMNEEVANVTLEKALENASYTSQKIQK
ncbi:hypothetical protein ACLB2K_022603 [Fragaria x ananassa]